MVKAVFIWFIAYLYQIKDLMVFIFAVCVTFLFMLTTEEAI